MYSFNEDNEDKSQVILVAVEHLLKPTKSRSCAQQPSTISDYIYLQIIQYQKDAFKTDQVMLNPQRTTVFWDYIASKSDQK